MRSLKDWSFIFTPGLILELVSNQLVFFVSFPLWRPHELIASSLYQGLHTGLYQNLQILGTTKAYTHGSTKTYRYWAVPRPTRRAPPKPIDIGTAKAYTHGSTKTFRYRALPRPTRSTKIYRYLAVPRPTHRALAKPTDIGHYQGLHTEIYQIL